MDQNHNPQASVHLGDWKLVAKGDFFEGKPKTSPTFELYNLTADPSEKENVAAQNPKVVAQLGEKLREFGSWQSAGVDSYDEGREGFKAPKDWVITK